MRSILILLVFASLFSCKNEVATSRDAIPSTEKDEQAIPVSTTDEKNTVTMASDESEQEEEKGEEVKNEQIIPKPRIKFDKPRFRFGDIFHADKVQHDFEFANIGDAPLEIKDVKVSCGCTTPSYPFLPIAPGETGIIGVTYNSVGKQGFQKATIRVLTNDPTQSEVRLYLSGNVLPKPRDEKDQESK